MLFRAMQITDPAWWFAAGKAVVTEPLLIPVIIATAGAVWWARGKSEKSARDGLESEIRNLKSQNSSEVTGLRAQNEALRSQNEAAEAHRRFAEARAQDAIKDANEAQRAIISLETRLKAGEPSSGLIGATGPASVAIGSSLAANAEVVRILKEPPSTIRKST